MAEQAGRAVTTRRLAIFDLDGTLTRADTFGPFVLGLLARHPLRWPRVPLLLIPLAAYALRLLDRGGLKGAILHALFGGMPRDTVDDWSAAYAMRVVPARMHAAALEVLRAHLAGGDFVILLSASPDLYVPTIGALLGVQQTLCSEVRWDGDRLDGRLSSENRRGEEKLRVVEELRHQHPGLSAIAYGNSISDLAHMLRCEESIYVNAGHGLSRRLAAAGGGLRCVEWR